MVAFEYAWYSAFVSSLLLVHTVRARDVSGHPSFDDVLCAELGRWSREIPPVI